MSDQRNQQGQQGQQRAQQQPERQAPRPTGKVFVLCESSEFEEAIGVLDRLDDAAPQRGAKPINELPLARVDADDVVCALVRRPGSEYREDPKRGRVLVPGKLEFTEMVRAADHWTDDPRRGSGRVNPHGFITALSRVIMPATIKRKDPKHDEDAIRIAYC